MSIHPRHSSQNGAEYPKYFAGTATFLYFCSV